MMSEFTKDQLVAVKAFLAQVRARADVKPDEQVTASLWARSAGCWGVYDFSEINILTALWWYQYRHKPGSKEWHPSIILRALIQASQRDYIEPEWLPSNDITRRALNASGADKKKARLQFIRRHGVGKFFKHVEPILRRGGVKALMTAPAIAETKEYVRILATIAGRNSNNGGNNGGNNGRRT